MRLHILHPNGPVESTEWHSLDTARLTKLVAGEIELVAVLFNGEPATLVVNEVGAVQDRAINPAGQLQPNARATALYWTATIQGITGVPFDPLNMPMIHGTAVLIEVDNRRL